MKMKMVPTSEKQDATRSVVSSALDSPSVKAGIMVGRGARRVLKSDGCSFPRRDQAYMGQGNPGGSGEGRERHEEQRYRSIDFIDQ